MNRYYETLVERALQERESHVTLLESVPGIESAIAIGKAVGVTEPLGLWLSAFNEVNEHITVDRDKFGQAVAKYDAIGEMLCRELEWPDASIRIHSQGSARTKTLIKQLGNEHFDVDAVCEVDISRIEAANPQGFFEKIGVPLIRLEAERKNRCWKIPYAGESFYLEFTPSVPMGYVSDEVVARMNPLFGINEQYRGTALAVVDNEEKRWKSSNPEGFAEWVNTVAQNQLFVSPRYDFSEALAKARVEAVPDQEVPLQDTLRVAIRLCKRHRDVCVRRGVIDGKYKPISVILVTLLTAAHQFLTTRGQIYSHPFQALLELIDVVDSLARKSWDGHQYVIPNPTVEGENFAEKWTLDDGRRAKSFFTWSDTFRSDLKAIGKLDDAVEIRRRIREIFRIPSSTNDADGSGGSGFAPSKNRPVRPVPATTGLA